MDASWRPAKVIEAVIPHIVYYSIYHTDDLDEVWLTSMLGLVIVRTWGHGGEIM